GLDDVVNLLGRGIHFADVVNTVSERYAAEIQRPEFGEGLDEVLRANVHKLYGIVNGIDYEQFDPGRDPYIPHHYSATAPEAKALDRAELRTELGLERVDRPLCAIVSRFYDVKGLDLVEQALPAILGLGLQIVVIGTGDRRYEDLFRRVSRAAIANRRERRRLAARGGSAPPRWRGGRRRSRRVGTSASPVGEETQLFHPACARCVCLVEVVEHHPARGEVGDYVPDG